jgi:hypothetical protein
MQNVSQLTITDVRLVQLKTVKDVGHLEPAWNPGGVLHFRIGGAGFGATINPDFIEVA